MSDRSASLLTKAQRRRLSAGFDGAEGAKLRRDRKQIRDRLVAGVRDFEHLVDYPDGQFELATRDVDDEELERALGEMTVATERIRVLNGIDRSAVETAAHDRAAEADGVTPDRLDLRPAAERQEAVRQRAASEPPTAWMRRAEALLQASLVFLLPTLVLAAFAPAVVAGPAGVLGVVGGLLLASGLVVVGVRGLKNGLLPAVSSLREDPVAVVRRFWQDI